MGMHSNFYEPFCSKFGMMIDLSELNILILNRMISTLTQGYRDMRSLNWVTDHSQFSIELDGIWHAVETFWSAEP